MSNNAEKGMYGQQLAEEYLLNNGCEILERNFRVRGGEIDLIVRDGQYIVFVEVKYRKNLRYGYPREAVGSAKLRTIRRVAEYYIMLKRLYKQDFRIDVIEILDNDSDPIIERIENV